MAIRGSRFWTLIALAAVATAGIAIASVLSLADPMRGKLRLGADQANSEPFEVASSIAQVVMRSFPNLDIEVIPTGGSSDNVRRLADGKLDLALVPSDAVSRENVALIAALYPDLFQILVRPELGIASVRDLEGRRIAVPPVGTTENRAFWLLASQYGLPPERIEVVPLGDKAAGEAITAGKVDAIFGLRGPRNEQFRFLVNGLGLTVLPIDQAAAMQLRQPAFRAASLPKGAYRGTPPVPETDLPTVAVDRLLLARAGLPEDVVHGITRLLFENRRELTLRTPLATFIHQPDMESGTMLPVHAGALAYFDRAKPGFLEERADLFALLLSLGVVIGSIGLAIQRRLKQRKQKQVEVYTMELLELEKSAKNATTIPELNACKTRLTEILTQVVHDMQQRRISSDGLQLFSFIWESVNYTVNDHEEQLRLGPGVDVSPSRRRLQGTTIPHVV